MNKDKRVTANIIPRGKYPIRYNTIDTPMIKNAVIGNVLVYETTPMNITRIINNDRKVWFFKSFMK